MARRSVRWASWVALQDFDQLRDDLKVAFVVGGEDDGCEVRVDGAESTGVAPSVIGLCILAGVALDGEALSGFAVDGVAELDQDGALARAFDWRSESAPRAVSFGEGETELP